jgi:ABC-type uncharacterized transport system YnjBCD permease subunit
VRARAGGHGDRLGIGGATLAAFVAIGLLAIAAWRDWRSAGAAPNDRRRVRFLAFTALLLCGLSAVAVVFSALPAALAGTCT